MNVVYEGDVVSRVPVKAVGCAGEWNCVQQSVDRSHHLHRGYHLHQVLGLGLLTSSPSSLAGQLMIARLPEMKSFYRVGIFYSFNFQNEQMFFF